MPLPYGNAEDWHPNAPAAQKGNTPKVGAIMCWRKGGAGNQADGAGHVAIVEEIRADGSVLTSNSNYGGTLFYTKEFNPPNYNNYLGAAYTLQGFIYPQFEAQAAPDTNTLTAICGASQATEGQMRAYIQKHNPDAPDLAALYIQEGNAEGIRGDVAFAQSCLETGYFKYGGDVKPEQNNFAGIGATGGGVAGNSFATPQLGIRAQIQHLKAYASNMPLNGECVDPRFAYVARGCAPYVEWLGQQENPQGKGWAVGKGYGGNVLTRLAEIIATPEPTPEPTPQPPQAPAPELDNSPQDWERKAVDKAISRGIIQGDTAGNLRLHAAATRADVLVFLERCGVL
jgi:hypothetical protein